MNTPEELVARLVKQWNNPLWREKRLLSANSWPLELTIGKPDAGQFSKESGRVLQHIQHWRQMAVGEVDWIEHKYRDAGDVVLLPICWRLRKPSEWIQATRDAQVQSDYALLSRLITNTDPLFHRLLIRQLPRIRSVPEPEILQAAHTALQLEPGCAQGKPLRALSVADSDSKFFERHRRLLTSMLDLRFDDAVSEAGLEEFLGAVSDKDHWLLVVPLQPGLMPYKQLRIRASELASSSMPAGRILVVENEQCVHQLPQLNDCIAVLGAGLNLNWMQAEWLADCRLAYWGDLDTWGLAMLAKARGFQPRVQALMMDRQVFDQYEARSVVEPVPYQAGELPQLTEKESLLLRYLLGKHRGRLEQEFLPKELVERVISEWGK